MVLVQSDTKDTQKVTNIAFTYSSTWYQTSDKAKCFLNTTNFLYSKRTLLFIL